MERGTVRDGLEWVVAEIEDDRGLLKPDRLRERLEVLDRLDACFPEMVGAARGVEAGRDELCRRATAIRERLEAVNRELYDAIRCGIQRGDTGVLLRWVDSLQEGADAARGLAYDCLDELICGVLELAEPEGAAGPAEAEMVFYQPTPARHIFDLIGRTALTEADVLVDVGSGLGHVPLLVSVCTRARSIGIELEESYVKRARECARRLNVQRATFVRQDAREADLSTGTVFYLHTPFTGSILRTVLDRLKREAARGRIRICSYGPCTADLAEEAWLEAAGVPNAKRISLFCSRP
jgi:hypothetical protein